VTYFDNLNLKILLSDDYKDTTINNLYYKKSYPPLDAISSFVHPLKSESGAIAFARGWVLLK
jgi:hypothetical protein